MARFLIELFCDWKTLVGSRGVGDKMMGSQTTMIESTAGEIMAELARRGIAPGQRVTLAVEPDAPDDWIEKARLFARPKVFAEGWSDDDIDRFVKEERKAVQQAIR